jgi:flagellar basal body-associated protein FliL
MIKPTFFSELKRRQIYRGGVMYVVAGWVMVQVATSIFPYFNIPAWAIRLVVIAVLIGFPVALVCLWMFESIDPNEPEKHLHNRRQGGREDNSALTKMMETERLERQKQNEELIAALAQLKSNGPDNPQGSMNASVASISAQTTGHSAPPPYIPVPASPPKRKNKTIIFISLMFITLALAGAWILFSPQNALQATAATDTAVALGDDITTQYVAPGFAQVEQIGAELLRPLLLKLGISVAPERVFTLLLVLIGFLILRDLFRQFTSSRARNARQKLNPYQQ